MSRWDRAATLRRNQIESGKDLTFTRVFVPLWSSIVKTIRPHSVLEAGIGTGHLALELSRYTSHYVGVEPSRGMLAEAADVLTGTDVKLMASTIQAVQSDPFDLVLSHMCLHAVEHYFDFLESIERLLKCEGVFLLSIPHPAFFNEYKKLIPDSGFSYMQHHAAVVDFRITLDAEGTIQQVPYFHRPLEAYLSAMARAGLVLYYMREVYPDAATQALYGVPWRTPRYLVLGGTSLRALVRAERKGSVWSRLFELAGQAPAVS
jgi:SAM-dependent methyltransferase